MGKNRDHSKFPNAITVLDNGNVGIGISNPSFAAGTGLAISDASRSNLMLTDGTNIYNIFQTGVDAYADLRTTGNIVWRTTSGNIERMRLTNSGNLGIGINPQGAGTAKTLEIGSRGIIYDNNDNFLYGNNGWVDSGTWKYKQTGYAAILATNGGTFTFSTAPSGTQNNAITWTDRFVIQNGGNVGIGTNNPTHLLSLYGASEASIKFQNSGATRAYIYANSGELAFNSLTSNPVRFYMNDVEKMSLTTAGNLTIAGILTESSSIRYKTNVETIKYGLDKVLQLRGVSYDKKESGIKELGLIAEEVNEILPDVVIKNEEGQPDSVSYGRIVSVLIEAIKDLKQEINEINGKLKV